MSTTQKDRSVIIDTFKYNPLSKKVIDVLDAPPFISAYVTTLNSLTQDILDGLINANSPSSLNPFATLADIAGTGITSLNGLLPPVQTFSKVDDTNMSLTITSAVANHQFALAWVGTLADARIASAATWNAKLSTIAGIAAGGDLSGTYTNPTVAKILNNTVPANAAGALTNDGAGNLSWTPAGTASLTATYVGYGSGANALTGDANLTWDSVNKILLDKGTVIAGDTGGVYLSSAGAGVGGIGFNSTPDGGYLAGVTGYGALMQLAVSTGQFSMFLESSVVAGAPHGHTPTISWDNTGKVTLSKGLEVGILNNTLGTVALYGSASGLVTIQPKAIAGTWTLTIPDATASVNGYALTSLTTGVSSWTNITDALLTGYISGAGTVAATDTILQAIQKLNGNATTLYVPYTGASGSLNMGLFSVSAATVSATTVTASDLHAHDSLSLGDLTHAFHVKFIIGETESVGRQLSIKLNDADRILTIAADATISGTNTGDQTISLTTDVTGSGTGSIVTTIAANAVSNSKFRQSGALSVVGRSANSAGNVADISATATSDAVLRESGSTLGFGTVATGGIANNAVTYAKIQAVSTTSKLLGSSSTTTAVQEITIGTGLSLSGTTLTATAASGANTALSNLAAVAINASLIWGADGTLDLGDATHQTNGIYMKNGGFIGWDGGGIAGSIQVSTSTMIFANSTNYTFDAVISPSAATVDLGITSTHPFRNLFLAATGKIDWGGGDVTLTGGTNTLTFAGASSGYTFDAATTIGTGNAFTCGTIELGAASDTTLARVSAGLISVEGKTVLTNTTTAGVAASPTATQTDTITHGLGRVPTIIRIYGIGGFTNNTSAVPCSQSMGVFNSSGNRCVYQRYNASAVTTAQASETSTTFAVFLGTSNGNFVSGIIQNVTSTTFDIAWTETGTSAAQNYMWECQ